MNRDTSILFVILASLGLYVGGVLGWSLCSDSWRQEIVDKGFAEWQIVKGTRTVEFKWKENQ